MARMCASSHTTRYRRWKKADKVSLDGGTIGLVSVRWMAPPRFYARGAFLALYVGVDEEIVRVLQTTFGVPFAGEGAPTPDVVTSNPGLDDAALIVVGSAAGLERLVAYLPEKQVNDDLLSTDLTQNWIVAIFRGTMPTAGYGIEIESVRTGADGQVLVEVSLDGPGIDELVAQVITYPVDVKVVPRQDLEDPSDTGWLAQTADGKVLARFAVR